jgi:hypothetical protein
VGVDVYDQYFFPHLHILNPEDGSSRFLCRIPEECHLDILRHKTSDHNFCQLLKMLYIYITERTHTGNDKSRCNITTQFSSQPCTYLDDLLKEWKDRTDLGIGIRKGQDLILYGSGTIKF